MNTHACIIVTTYSIFDHYDDPRNIKRNANHNATKHTNIVETIRVSAEYLKIFCKIYESYSYIVLVIRILLLVLY